MFKEAEKISRAIDSLIKVADKMKNDDRKNELTCAIHKLSIVHQNVLGDLAGNPGALRDTINDTVSV